MTVRGRTKALVVGLATSVVALAVVLPQHASATTPDSVAVLAGSADFLVYDDVPVGADGRTRYGLSELRVLSADGVERDLGSGWGTGAPGASDTARFSIVGAMLTGYRPTDPDSVEWWDLSAHTSGVTAIPDGATWQGSAPGGWVLVGPNGKTVEIQSPGGQLEQLGSPQHVPIRALSGPTGIVALGTTSHDLTYQAWTAPTTVVPLDAGAVADPASLVCTSASRTTLACGGVASQGGETIEVAVPLDGKPGVSTASCTDDVVAVHRVLVTVCGTTDAHPRFTARSGTGLTSTTPVALSPGVSALGTFVTVGPRREAALGIADADVTAEVLHPAADQLTGGDDDALRAAAHDVELQALTSGALRTPPDLHLPAQILQASSDALIRAAVSQHPSNRGPHDTRSLMGVVPRNLRHRTHDRPRHFAITATHSLRPFSRALPDHGSTGFGMHRTHGGSYPAPFRTADSVFVDPTLPSLHDPTIGMVALRTALGRLGQPYVWAAAGPETFDCSGLVQWAYAHAGVALTHFSGDQWNEGRLIPPRDILPGDLILFAHHGPAHVIHHVGIYLGADWMLNAPYTGQYVDVVRIPNGVAGVVRP